MPAENTTWGEERIANELKLKLGIRSHPAPWRTICETGVRRVRPIPSSVGIGVPVGLGERTESAGADGQPAS
jgi:hypothetical protein